MFIFIYIFFYGLLYQGISNSGNLMLTIKPYCNTSNDLHMNDDSIIESNYNSNNCDLGCSCNRLHLYVKSCLMKNCKIQDKFPSEIIGDFYFLFKKYIFSLAL